MSRLRSRSARHRRAVLSALLLVSSLDGCVVGVFGDAYVYAPAADDTIASAGEAILEAADGVDALPARDRPETMAALFESLNLSWSPLEPQIMPAPAVPPPLPPQVAPAQAEENETGVELTAAGVIQAGSSRRLILAACQQPDYTVRCCFGLLR